MTVEYMVLLLVSGVIMAGAFGLNNGPIKMFKKNTPFLGHHIEEKLETGKKFQEKSNPGEGWEDSANPPI